jgi:hypothetical protein
LDLVEVDFFTKKHAAVTRPGRVGRVHPRTHYELDTENFRNACRSRGEDYKARFDVTIRCGSNTVQLPVMAAALAPLTILKRTIS